MKWRRSVHIRCIVTLVRPTVMVSCNRIGVKSQLTNSESKLSVILKRIMLTPLTTMKMLIRVSMTAIMISKTKEKMMYMTYEVHHSIRVTTCRHTHRLTSFVSFVSVESRSISEPMMKFFRLSSSMHVLVRPVWLPHPQALH